MYVCMYVDGASGGVIDLYICMNVCVCMYVCMYVDGASGWVIDLYVCMYVCMCVCM